MSLQEEIEILGSQIANFGATSGGVAEVENPIVELQVTQQINDFRMNANDYQNDLNSQLPHQTFEHVQNDDQMISPLFCLGEEKDGFFECNTNNNVVETSTFDHVSTEDNFACYPW